MITMCETLTRSYLHIARQGFYWDFISVCVCFMRSQILIGLRRIYIVVETNAIVTPDGDGRLEHLIERTHMHTL